MFTIPMTIFPKCNKNTDTATPSQRCDGTLLPLIHPYGGMEHTIMVIWKCTECGRTIDQHTR
jgi:hypothetical protein